MIERQTMEGIFFDLTILLVVAAALGVGMHVLRLPTILGYLLAGALAASLGLIGAHNEAAFRPLADIGIALLLFMVGIEMNVRDLKEIGKSVAILGLAQITVTGVASFGIGRLIGLDQLASLYLALALTMSSTIIVVRLLSQKQHLTSLYGKISVGLLLVQDLVAVLALVLLAGFNPETGLAPDLTALILTIGKAILLIGNVIILSQTVIPYLVHRISRAPELLFIVSIAWAFGIAALTSSELIGFSIEIGGFLAGLALANSLEHFQIASRIRPLRDFFVLLFFVLLGSQVKVSGVGGLIAPLLLLSVFVLLVKPLITLALMGTLGFRRQVSFLTALTQTQISEFSLLLLALGLKLTHVSGAMVALLTLVGVVTMTISTILIHHGEEIFRKLSRSLTLFERRGLANRVANLVGDLNEHVVLVGSHRTGHNILPVLKRQKVPFVVVDFDPQIVDALQDREINVIFGDISDEEVQEQAQLSKAKLIVSTVSDRNDTLRLLVALKRLKKRPATIVTAQTPEDAREFYQEGADYVLLPHFVSGEHVADIIAGSALPTRLATLKEEHQKLLQSLTNRPV